MADAFSYLNGLFQTADDELDEAAFDWDVKDAGTVRTIPESWKLNQQHNTPFINASDAVGESKTSPPGQLTVVDVDGDDETSVGFDVDEWQTTMQHFARDQQERSLQTDVETCLSKPEMSRATLDTIGKWNRKNETMTAVDWSVVERELERCDRKHTLKETRKKKRDAKRMFIPAERTRSLIADFGETIASAPWFVCVICRRQFPDNAQLDRHCQESIYHTLNVRELKKNGYDVLAPSLRLEKETEFAGFADNIGMVLLKHLGWKEGEQLGKGRETMKVDVNPVRGRAGIGATPSCGQKESALERSRRKFFQPK